MTDFLHEMRVVMDLMHPNIVHIQDNHKCKKSLISYGVQTCKLSLSPKLGNYLETPDGQAMKMLCALVFLSVNNNF